MMPLSRKLRNMLDDPFFNAGVASLTLFKSSMVSVRRLSRAENIKFKLVFTSNSSDKIKNKWSKSTDCRTFYWLRPNLVLPRVCKQ